MSVYAIAQISITEPESYNRYQSRFMEVFSKFKGELLAADENPQVLEGVWEQEKIILMKFRIKKHFGNGHFRPNIRKFQKTEKPDRKELFCWSKESFEYKWKHKKKNREFQSNNADIFCLLA